MIRLSLTMVALVVVLGVVVGAELRERLEILFQIGGLS